MPDLLFDSQSLLTIRLDTEMDLTAITSVKILYKKPSGTKGSWNATKSGTEVVYECQAGNIDQPGKWLFQAEITAADGRKATGEIVKQTFLETIK